MSFDLQPVLKGELLELRPLRAEDFYDLYAVAADPLIWSQHPIKDRCKEEVFKIFFREALESGGIKARRRWPRQFCLPNHCFNLRAGRAYLMLFPVIAGSAEPLERGRFRDIGGKLEARAKTHSRVNLG